ncbi:MAG: GNAT family N-acetyltransferase [Candidatus Moduliflexus flocculans]|nr:GNAT family N-acetyltransferase [Candidatus Moduliflexus flocculans]
MGARLHNRLPGLDHDRLDGYCQHLIVRDALGQVVGCTRLLTAEAARRAGGVSTRPLVWWSRGLCRILTCGCNRAGRLMLVQPCSWPTTSPGWTFSASPRSVPPSSWPSRRWPAWPLFGWLCRRACTAFIRRGGDARRGRGDGATGPAPAPGRAGETPEDGG